MIISAVAVVIVIFAVAGLAAYIRVRNMRRWFVPYLLQAPRRRKPRVDEEVHVLLCIADHYEPKVNNASPERARARVQLWLDEYPKQFGHFRDSDGRPPRYSFFYPVEEYEPEYLDSLAELCRAGFGEVEIHLHHQNDTAENLRSSLRGFKELLAERHGLLSRRKDTGEIVYAFIHGNWALCNSRPDGRCCGVNEELDVLLDTGCYVDMTYPSAPSPTQPPKINTMYYAKTLPGQARSAERGMDIGLGPQPPDSLLLIPGPLLLDWSDRKWGIAPRLENGCLQASQPPSIDRLERWLKARVQVPARPDWFFVKLHAHGAIEASHEGLLGEPMRRFHEDLARRARDNPRFHYHYVTAREMYNLAKAAEAGWKGSVAEARDWLLVSNVAQKRDGHAGRDDKKLLEIPAGVK